MGQSAGWLGETVKKLRSFAYAPRTKEQQPTEEQSTQKPERLKIGLALGGGFARGITHIGVLRVFEQERIPIDYLAGTSVGALVAAAYAGGCSLDLMEKVGQATRFNDFAEWSVCWQGLASDTRLQRYLCRMTPMRWFEELRIPLTIAATDLITAEPVYLSTGEIGPALCASCAYPGLFRPVERDGRLLVDGFLAAPVPVEAVRKMGADFVIGVHLSCASKNQRPTNLFEIVSQTFAILSHYGEARWRPLADLVIEPDVSEFRWDDFPKTPALVAAGERAAREALPLLRAALVSTIEPPKPLAASESEALPGVLR
jgi:NTE family protein